jgi:hypothetical protein
MPFGFHHRCAVTGECWFVGAGWDFETYDEAQYCKGLFAALGKKHWISVRELLAMTELALQILAPELCDRRDEMAQLVWQAKQDEETLRIIEHLNQPLEAVLAIRQRSFDALAKLWSWLPPDEQEKMIERLAPGWAEVRALQERTRALALRQVEKHAERRRRGQS